ncbi:MAG: hypothetical protein ACJ8C4_07150 [Gemmataceae bacterium]
MSERRSLVEGLTTPADPKVEEEFVFGSKKARAPAVAQIQATAPGMTARVPLSARVRTDIAVSLKRVSLERQLAGIYPNTLQAIMEAALTTWLEAEGEGR